MFPLADYFQVLIVYLIIGLILWLPPLIIPQWKVLVKNLNKKEIKNKKRFELFLIILSLSIIIITFILISFSFNFARSTYQENKWRIEFKNADEEPFFFNIFAAFTFILTPIAMGIIATIAYIHNVPKLKLGEFFILLFAFSALALAGSFYHDFLWCGSRTNWYTELAEGGYDFEIWTLIVGVNSRDYRLLGASQGTLAIILIVFSFILIWKFNSFLEIKLNTTKKIQIIIHSLLGVIFLGFFLFVIDYGAVFDFNTISHSLYAGIPLICLLFYQIGRALAPNSNLNGKKL